MKTRLRLAALALALTLPRFARAESATRWKIDPEHSLTSFAVKHLGISTVRGELGPTTGEMVYDAKDLTRSTIHATIDVTAINTREPKRDTHLRSDAFFDTAHFPTATFTSTKVERAGPESLRVTGDLTIRGKTRPVVLAVSFTGQQVTAYGETHLSASGTTRINRQDFGVSFNDVVDGGGLLIANEVDITVDLEAIQEKASEGKTEAK